MRQILRGGGLAGALLVATAGFGQITESATTVAPGHFLLEMDALSLSLNHEAGNDYTALGVASTFLTTGLTANWDVQVGAELFLNQKFNEGGLTDHRSGIGDLYLRTKWRFYTDEATDSAIAVMPYVKLPTSTGGVGKKAVEGGVIVPWETKLIGGFNLQAMAELDFLRNDNDNGYDTFWYGTMAVQRPLTKMLALYGEAAVGKSSGGTPWDGRLGAGVILTVSPEVSWDYALYRGISSGASDWTHVLRFNWGF